MRRAVADLALLAAAAAWFPAVSNAACARAEVLFPERGARVSEPRPAIEWRALPGVSRYRVQVESRVPEGRVVSRTDTMVEGTRFVPPSDLAQSRASVKLLVTEPCASDRPAVADQTGWFYVDRAASCAAVAELSVSGSGKVAWSPVPSATRYDIVLYAMPEGTRVASAESRAAAYDAPFDPAPMMVAVRARCGTALGPAAYGFLPAR